MIISSSRPHMEPQRASCIPCAPPRICAARITSSPSASRATLIVVPVPLVSQWMAEIAKSVGAGASLTYRKYTCDDLIKRDAAGAWGSHAPRRRRLAATLR